MAVTFKSFRIIPNFSQVAVGSGGFDVYWEIEGNNFTPNFQVAWSETEDGPWTDLLLTRTTNNFALAVAPPTVNQQAIRWFRIQVYNNDLPLISQVVVATSWAMDHRNRMNRREYLFFREHLRRLRLTLEKPTGVTGWLLRRKISGTVCPDCCDEIIETPVSQECATCFGTGLDGGYWDPVKMWTDWGKEGPASTANTNDISVGPSQVVQTQMLLFPLPEAKSHDIWVDIGTRHMYEIIQSDPIHYKGTVFCQRIAMTRLPAHHPAYRFPLPLS